jgi:hypothetical protein
MTNRRVQTGQQDGTFRGCHSHYRYHRSLGDTLPETGREAGGKRVFRREGRGVSPYPRRIQRPLQTITAPAAKYCMGRCKVLHRTLKTYSSSFPSRNFLIIGMLPYYCLLLQRYIIILKFPNILGLIFFLILTGGGLQIRRNGSLFVYRQ